MTRWYAEHKREPYYRQAKREGYRARSAYKLLQIQERFRVLRPGAAVVDLGCSPGGWTQVLVGLVGPQGRVVGVDREHTAPIPGATLLRGDVTEPETIDAIRGALGVGGSGWADVVVSDMSPNISGAYDRDQAESVWLAGHALKAADALLGPGGGLVVKVFEGQDFPELMADLRARFARVGTYRPPASRKSSSEVYVVARGFRRPTAAATS